MGDYEYGRYVAQYQQLWICDSNEPEAKKEMSTQVFGRMGDSEIWALNSISDYDLWIYSSTSDSPPR